MKIIFLIFPVVLLAGYSFADSISLYGENDFMHRTDGWYTQGTQIKYDSDNLWGMKIDQAIYTPENKDDPDPVRGDRPYAGYLHLDGFKHFCEGKQDDYIELSLGVIGPASGAEAVQSGFHKITGMAIPQGWKWQLKNEPTVNAAYYKSYSVMLEKWLEYKPLGGVNLGNVLVDAELGNCIRVGYNLPREFSPLIYNFASDTKKPKDKNFYCYAFAGVIGKTIAYNQILDGSLFQDEPVTVRHNNFVADGFIGACIGFWQLELTITHVVRTEEWLSQPDRDNEFESVKISLKI